MAPARASSHVQQVCVSVSYLGIGVRMPVYERWPVESIAHQIIFGTNMYDDHIEAKGASARPLGGEKSTI